jgi:hypothetical protein
MCTQDDEDLSDEESEDGAEGTPALEMVHSHQRVRSQDSKTRTR